MGSCVELGLQVAQVNRQLGFAELSATDIRQGSVGGRIEKQELSCQRMRRRNAFWVIEPLIVALLDKLATNSFSAV